MHPFPVLKTMSYLKAWRIKLAYSAPAAQVQERSQIFKMRGSKGGSGVGGGDRDSKWRLSIDLCTKCHFIWGSRGDWTSDWGLKHPFHHPPAQVKYESAVQIERYTAGSFRYSVRLERGKGER